MGAQVDDAGQIDWGFSHQTVVYDHALAAQDFTRVRFHGDKLYTDDAHTKPLDTTRMVTANMGPGYAIYVMSDTGSIHVSSHSVGNRHHSSLLAGGNVAGAGELQVHAGTLKWISNKSGHYFPEVAHFLQTIQRLMKNGVPLDNVRLNFLYAGGPQKGDPYDRVEAFLVAMKVAGNDYEYNKLLSYTDRYSGAALSALLKHKGWRVASWDEDAMGVRGVVTLAGAQVAHREVRKWLKSQGYVASMTVKDAQPWVQKIPTPPPRPMP
jgi:hypothetical protein